MSNEVNTTQTVDVSEKALTQKDLNKAMFRW